MNFNSRITLAIQKFFKKNGRTILIVFIVWLIVVLINNYLKKQPKTIEIKNTYNPDKAIIDDNGDVPQMYRSTIKEAINKYFNYCNSKEYEKAYEMLTPDCQRFLYDNNTQTFKTYVDQVYDGYKIYNIQSYSNIGEVYIYDMHILNDIEATGTTDGYDDYVEKVIIRKINNEFKISNQGYVGNEQLNKSAEDDNIKVFVDSRDMSYQKESYNMHITNKSDNYIIISNNQYNNEVTLNIGNEKRKATNISDATFVLAPHETKEFIFMFNKFYDDELETLAINFNMVRVVSAYKAGETENSNNTLETYSFNISLE